MSNKKPVSATATYDRDSKRYHRYIVDEGQAVVGTIYIPKDKDVPKQVVIDLRVKGEKIKNGE